MILSIFIFAAVVSVLACAVARSRLKNQLHAAKYQRTIALITYDFNNDKNAPEEAVELINTLADHVFDNEMIQQVIKQKRSHKYDKEISIRDELRRRFGKFYGNRCYQALEAMAYITMLNYLSVGFLIRFVDEQKMKESSRSVSRIVRDEVVKEIQQHHAVAA